MVEVCTGTMVLKNDQQYGCQTGNNLKEKSRDLHQNSSRFCFKIKMKQCSVVDMKTVRSLEFYVVLLLSLIFCKQEYYCSSGAFLVAPASYYLLFLNLCRYSLNTLMQNKLFTILSAKFSTILSSAKQPTLSSVNITAMLSTKLFAIPCL